MCHSIWLREPLIPKLFSDYLNCESVTLKKQIRITLIETSVYQKINSYSRTHNEFMTYFAINLPLCTMTSLNFLDRFECASIFKWQVPIRLNYFQTYVSPNKHLITDICFLTRKHKSKIFQTAYFLCRRKFTKWNIIILNPKIHTCWYIGDLLKCFNYKCNAANFLFDYIGEKNLIRQCKWAEDA